MHKQRKKELQGGERGRENYRVGREKERTTGWGERGTGEKRYLREKRGTGEYRGTGDARGVLLTRERYW